MKEDFPDYESEQAFESKIPAAKQWVREFLEWKGIDMSAVHWLRPGPRHFKLVITDSKRDRELNVDFDARRIAAIADEDERVRAETMKMIEAFLQAPN